MRVRIKIYKLVKRVFQYFCFPDRSIKGGDILDFKNGGVLEKGEEVDLEKGGMNPFTNYVSIIVNIGSSVNHFNGFHLLELLP